MGFLSFFGERGGCEANGVETRD